MHEEDKANKESLDKIHQSGSIHYGDIVQLEHTVSKLFIEMKNHAAAVNGNNRRVALSQGSQGAYFKVLPCYKIRSIGSAVFDGDEIILESVRFSSNALSASLQKELRGHSEQDCESQSQLPRALRKPRMLEVNGCLAREGKPVVEMDENQTKFFVTLLGQSVGHDELDGARGDDHSGADTKAEYVKNAAAATIATPVAEDRRYEAPERFLTSLTNVRLFHPEFHGFLSASCNPDKGEEDMLDHDGAARVRRPLKGSSATTKAHLACELLVDLVDYVLQTDDSSPSWQQY